MAFKDNFDSAVNKAKEVFDAACKKTGEVVNLQKLKIDASALESKREEDFAALGKIYFDSIKDSADLDKKAAELVSAVKEKTEQIDKLHDEISAYKNKRVCPACGAFVDKNSVYCSLCGAKITFDGESD